MDKFLSLYAYIFARKSFFKLNFFLFHLSLRGLGILNYVNFRASGEKFLHDYLKRNHDLSTIFDVGANQGNYAAIYQDISQTIVCFEPHPKTADGLAKRFANRSNVSIMDVGLSNEELDTIIYDYEENSGSTHASLYKEVINDIHSSKAVEIDIRLKTLDEVCEQLKIEKINLLKIDTEGNEYKCLEGAKKMIDKKSIEVIHLEFNEMNVYSGVFMKDFVEILSGYNIYRLLPNGFLPLNYKEHRPLRFEIFAYQNIIAFRKDVDLLS